MKKILVIDDEDSFRFAVTKALRRQGYETLEASSGREGLQMALAELPDLVVSDVNMEGLDGVALLKSLRAQPATSLMQVILMTGATDALGIRQGMEQGADDYLAKPFSMEALSAAVRARLERQQEIQAHEAANQTRLLDILSATQDLIAIAGADSGQLLYLNPAGRKMLGVPPEEEISRLRLADFHADATTAAAQQAEIAEAKQAGIWLGESEFINRAGLRVLVSKQILVHRSSARETAYISVVARDITERKQMEEALRASENRYRSLVDSQGEGVVTVDADQRLAFANPAAENIFGVATGQLAGRNLRDFLAAKDREILASHVELRKAGQRSNYQIELCTPGGERRQILITGTPRFDPQGRFCGSFDVFRDITELKRATEQVTKSERLLRTILDVLPQRVFWKDRQGCYVGANNRFLEDCGTSNIVGKTDHDLPWTREQADAFRVDDQDVIESGLPKLDIIQRVILASGETRWLSTSKVPMRDSAGAIVGVLGTYLDITALKRAEQERQMMDLQLRQSQKLESIGQLAAGIAHEINTPTQYIGDNTRFLKDAFADLSQLLQGYATLTEAARSGQVTPESVRAVDELVAAKDIAFLTKEIPVAVDQSLEGIQRVTKIVRAMKEFSHPGVEQKTAIDLNRAIESTLMISRNEWKYVADLVTQLDPGLPPVPCLPGEFNQVILNLVINAAHAITDVVGQETGRLGTITVSTRLEGDWVKIGISDTGTGIPEKVRDRIFDPFFTTKAVGKGTGQGLAIARSVIVGKHGGQIDFETETGKGTTFYIRLPLKPVSLDAQTSPQL